MPAPTKSFTNITNGTLTAGEPWTQSLTRQFRDNDEHLEEWLGKDYAAAQNHDHNGVNSAAISLAGQNLFLNDTGDGSDGAVTESSSGNINPGVYNYTTYTINSSVTKTVQYPGPLVIRATTSITINGAIAASGKGGLGGYGSLNCGYSARPLGMFCGGGGGGGGSDDANETGGNGGVAAGAIYTDSLGADNATGANGTTVPTPFKDMVLQGLVSWFYGGGGGGQGNGNGSTRGAAGGNGGGLVILIAPTITFGASASINCSGANGSAGGTGLGGGGGGGGGVIIVAYDGTGGAFTDSSSGAYVNVAGGTGGNGGSVGTKDGGNGGAGWNVEFDYS